MSRELSLSVATEDGQHVVAAAGELDMDSSPRLLQAIKDAVGAGVGVRLDLSGVSYIDSSGIAVLIQGLKIARRASVGYALVNPAPQVMSVIELSQLRDFFPIEVADAQDE